MRQARNQLCPYRHYLSDCISQEGTRDFSKHCLIEARLSTVFMIVLNVEQFYGLLHVVSVSWRLHMEIKCT